jgi:hypothetical protein
MRQLAYSRPTLEHLENRWAPTILASVKNGILTVSGAADNSTDTVLVKETSANTFEVDDVTSGGSSTVVASGLTDVNSVRLNLTGTSNILSVDLGGNTLAGSLIANLGNTNNSLSVADGTISGSLRVRGGSGTDAVTIGSADTTLTVAHDSSVRLESLSGDSIKVLSGVTFQDDLSGSAASTTLNQGSTVQDSLHVFGGGGDSSVTVNGTVGGNLSVGGGFCHHDQAGSTSLTLGASGSVGGNLYFSGSGASDNLDIAGTITGNAFVRMFGSNNSATVESTASIGGADFRFGNGSSALTLAGTIGTSGSTGTVLRVSTGNGADTVTFSASAVINGNARVRLGSGADNVSLKDSAIVTGTFALQGRAASSFHGSATTNHPTLDLSAFKGTTDSSPNP